MTHAPALQLPGATLAAAPLHRDPVRAWLLLWCVVLAGYAGAGRGFAYLGVPPLFIGELTMLTGLLLLAACPAWRALLQLPTMGWLLLLGAWAGARTLPYLGTYKLDAVRDVMIVGYAVFLPLVAAWIIARPGTLALLLRRYHGFIYVLLAVMPVVWLGQKVMEGRMPRWPWAGVEIIDVKGGDTGVHLAGAAAFAVVGLAQRRWTGWPVLVLINVALIGAVNRGGMVAFTAGMVVALCFYPRSTWARRMAIVGVVTTAALALINPSIPIGDGRREISFEQLSANVTSIVSDREKKGDLDDTKTWRLQWWTRIVEYTVYGDYFWTGRGFGVNLATADGFQVWEDASLRSPHNGHMTILARTGVPGLALWVLVHLSWALAMTNAALSARRRGLRVWAGLFVFLLAYWLAFLVNASFDVYLEGPMGGVWLWSVMGVGLGAAWVYRRRPGELADEAWFGVERPSEASAAGRGEVAPCV